MTYRPYPKYASRDPHQGPLTTCTDCGFLWNQKSMQFQFDYVGGPTPINLGYLRCPRCITPYTEQRRLLIIAPDPPLIFNTRPEPYYVDETTWLIDGTPDASGQLPTGDIITTGVTSDSGPALIPVTPNPADVGGTTHLTTNIPLDPPQTTLDE